MSHPDRGAVFNVAFGRHDDKLSASDASGLESRDVATAGDGGHGDGPGDRLLSQVTHARVDDEYGGTIAVVADGGKRRGSLPSAPEISDEQGWATVTRGVVVS